MIHVSVFNNKDIKVFEQRMAKSLYEIFEDHLKEMCSVEVQYRNWDDRVIKQGPEDKATMYTPWGKNIVIKVYNDSLREWERITDDPLIDEQELKEIKKEYNLKPSDKVRLKIYDESYNTIFELEALPLTQVIRARNLLGYITGYTHRLVGKTMLVHCFGHIVTYHDIHDLLKKENFFEENRIDDSLKLVKVYDSKPILIFESRMDDSLLEIFEANLQDLCSIKTVNSGISYSIYQMVSPLSETDKPVDSGDVVNAYYEALEEYTYGDDDPFKKTYRLDYQNDTFIEAEDKPDYEGEAMKKEFMALLEAHQKYQEEVNHPDRYNKGGMEVWDIMEAYHGKEATQAFDIGCALKYILRYKHKGGLEDIKKAKMYLDHYISLEEDK